MFNNILQYLEVPNKQRSIYEKVDRPWSQLTAYSLQLRLEHIEHPLAVSVLVISVQSTA